TAYILSKTSEQRSRTSRDVISVRRDRLLRTKSELIVQIEINCQLVTVVIVGDTKAAANDGFMIRAKQLRQHSTLKSRRPRDGYARLEVVLVPPIQRRSIICWSGEVHRDGVKERYAPRRTRNPHIEVIRKWDVRLDLKPVGFINRTAKAVA